MRGVNSCVVCALDGLRGLDPGGQCQNNPFGFTRSLRRKSKSKPIQTNSGAYLSKFTHVGMGQHQPRGPGSSLCFHLPGIHVGYLILTHTHHVCVCVLFWCELKGKAKGKPPIFGVGGTKSTIAPSPAHGRSPPQAVVRGWRPPAPRCGAAPSPGWEQQTILNNQTFVPKKNEQ